VTMSNQENVEHTQLAERGQPPPGAYFAHAGLANSVTGMSQRKDKDKLDGALTD